MDRKCRQNKQTYQSIVIWLRTGSTIQTMTITVAGEVLPGLLKDLSMPDKVKDKVRDKLRTNSDTTAFPRSGSGLETALAR